MNKVIQTLSAIVSRANLLNRLGKQYDGDRDIYQALGYPTTLEYVDYATQYSRQDIAKAVIDRPVNATWRDGVSIVETDDANETALEKAWNELDERLKLTSKFSRLDKLTGLGEYGILLLGLDDVKNQNDMLKPVEGNRKLLYVKPLGKGSAVIKTYDRNTSSARYGMPNTYSLIIVNDSDNSTTIEVHWTRVIHVVDGLMESETEGTPRLKPVFNRLKDLEKIVGGSGEMFWRGARPGYQGKLDDEYQMTDAVKDDLKDQINEYEHNLRRILVNEGVNLTALESQVSDPTNHVDIQIQMISAETGIPKRILTGSERGELSSGQDRDEWLTLVGNRRTIYAEPNIVRAFVDLMIKYGVLPAPEDSYSVKWVDLFAPSEKDKTEVGKTRAVALKEYTTNPLAEDVVPRKAFYRFFLGLKEEDIELIEEIQQAELEEEGAITSEEGEILLENVDA